MMTYIISTPKTQKNELADKHIAYKLQIYTV